MTSRCRLAGKQSCHTSKNTNLLGRGAAGVIVTGGLIKFKIPELNQEAFIQLKKRSMVSI
jgi:hypothetical protein